MHNQINNNPKCTPYSIFKILIYNMGITMELGLLCLSTDSTTSSLWSSRKYTPLTNIRPFLHT